MQNTTNKVEDHIKSIFGVAMRSGNQVGVTPDSSMRNKKGLDAIDREAEEQGRSCRTLSLMRPRTRKVYCRVR